MLAAPSRTLTHRTDSVHYPYVRWLSLSLSLSIVRWRSAYTYTLCVSRRNTIYSRYSTCDWDTSNKANFNLSERERSLAERLRADAWRTVKSTDQRTRNRQTSNSKRLGESTDGGGWGREELTDGSGVSSPWAPRHFASNPSNLLQVSHKLFQLCEVCSNISDQNKCLALYRCLPVYEPTWFIEERKQLHRLWSVFVHIAFWRIAQIQFLQVSTIGKIVHAKYCQWLIGPWLMWPVTQSSGCTDKATPLPFNPYCWIKVICENSIGSVSKLETHDIRG